MIKLYDKTGEVLIGELEDCISCNVTEVRNGIFDARLVYPAMRLISNNLIKENIIVCKASDILLNQKFRIFNVKKKHSNTIEVIARHISFDLLYDFIENINIVNQSCEYALNTIFRNSQFSRHYKGHSDIINAQDYNMSIANCLNAIAGKEGSIIDTYGTGAEILRDNENIHVLNRRGHDNSVTIEYGKNLEGFECTEDTTDLITRIYPFAKKSTPDGETTITLNEKFVDSPRINLYSHPYIREVDLTSKFKDEDEINQSKLKLEAEKYFLETKCDIPKLTFNLKPVPLSKCVGFENLGEKLSLCDIATIKHKIYGITTQAKVIKTVFNVLTDRYENIQLGDPKASLGDLIGGNSGNTPQVGPPGPPGPPGQDGNIGDFPDSLPAIPQLTANVLGFASVDLSWTYENKVYYNYQVFASKTENFEPNMFDLIFEGQASSFLHQVKPDETWYYRARAVNTHGKATELSTQVKVTTKKVDDFENYFSSVAIQNLVAGIFTVDYMTAGIVKGNWIDAKNLSVTDGNGKRTLDIDSAGNVYLDVNSFKIRSEKVNTEFEVIEKIQNAVRNYSQQVDNKFEEANSNLGALEGYIEGAFYDGIINASEAKSLRGLLDIIKQDKAVIDKEYNTLYSNNYLIDDFKQLLYNTKNTYNSAFSNYESKLTLIINQGSVTEEEQREINSLGNSYREAIKNYKDTVIQCLDSITSKRIEELDGTITDRFVRIETENGEIKNTVQGITSDIVDINGEVQKRVTETSFTQFKQEYDGFKLGVTRNYGSKNLIKNSGFLYGSNHFYTITDNFDGNPVIDVWGDNSEWVLTGTKAICIRGGNFTRGACGIRQDQIKLKPNTKYTIAFTAASHRCKWRLSLNTNGWGQLVWTEGNSMGGKDPNKWDNRSITFLTGPDPNEITNCKLDLVIQNDKGGNTHGWFTNLMLVEGDYAPKWTPKAGESYSNTVIIDEDNFKLMFENGNYAQLGRLGFEQQIGTMAYPYHCLGWAKAVGIPAGNPGKVNVRLPDEFDHCEAGSINWSVAQRGYYFSTTGSFFPFYVQVQGERLFKHSDGHWYVEIHGYSRIQNANNPGDVQNMPNGVNAMLTVNA
ncbi:phage tail spike protein (plasmid) [Clostridium perfringens]